MSRLLDLLYEVYNKLDYNTPYEKTYILNLLDAPNYTRTYKNIAFDKCVVNNHLRPKLGVISDLFYKQDNYYFKYSKDSYKGEYYSYDKEAVTEFRKLKKLEHLEIRDKFLEDYTPYEGEYVFNNDIAIVCSCCKDKIESINLIPAYDRYIGKEISIVKPLKDNYNIDLYIISAKYGLIPDNYLISYYNKSFNDISNNDIFNLVKDLKIRDQFEKLLSHYKMIFFCLGDKYLRTLNLRNSFDTNCYLVNIMLSKYKDTRLILKNKTNLVVNLEVPFGMLDNTDCLALTAKGKLIEKIFKTFPNKEFLENPELLKEVKIEPKSKPQFKNLFDL